MEQKLTKPILLLRTGMQKHFLIAKLVLLTFALSILGGNAYSLGADDLNLGSDNILQQIMVAGVVKDANGQPMPGVAVKVTGTTLGA